MKKITLQELLKAGVHFGHRKSRYNPKSKQYIYALRDGIHVIDLRTTLASLEKALAYAQKIAAEGGLVLFVGTKKQAKEITKAKAVGCSMPYVSERWLGGTFTNFKEIQKQVTKYLGLQEKEKKGDFEKYTKKERLLFQKEIARLEKNVGGLTNLKKFPEAILIVDLSIEKNAFAESLNKKVPVIAFVDTNVDPKNVAYPIPANDDAIKSIELILGAFADAINEGLKMKAEKSVPVAKVAKIEKKETKEVKK